jgi:polynucleotide 5'-kinase involved in rRNA processing
MKLEIEITEAEIRDAIAQKVRVAIADQTNQWSADEFIRNRVKEYWQEIAAQMVREVLQDSAEMRAKIVATIERKLRAQVSALMNRKE